MCRPRKASIRLISWLLLSGGLVALLFRSHTTTDILALYARNGTVQGIMSHDGQLLFGFSTVLLGPDRAWTTELLSTSKDEGQPLYDTVFGSWVGKRQFAGFGFLRTHSGDLIDAAATHFVLTIPTWLPAALASIPVLRSLAGLARRRGRRKRGQCQNCGYDLRGSGAICPECGANPSQPVPANSSRKIRTAASLAASILVAACLVAILKLAPTDATAPSTGPSIPPSPVHLAFNWEKHRDALRLMSQQASVPIELADRNSAGQFLAPSDVRVSARLIDAPLPVALDAVSRAVGESDTKLVYLVSQ